MPYELKELVKPIPAPEIEQIAYQMLDARGINTSAWKEGGTFRTLMSLFATLYSYVVYLVALIAQSGFLDLSTGKLLTLVAKYVYGVDRLAATFGTGTVTLHNTSGTTYDYAEGDLVATGSTGYEYKGAAATLNAGATLTIAIEATEAGSGPNLVLANQITRLATPSPGVEIDGASTVIGLDEETDDALRARCRGKMASLSINGPADSFRYFAVSATRPDGTSCGVSKTRITKDGTGNITLYVANSTGALASDDLAIVTAEARKARTICDNLTVVNAAAFNLDVTYTVYAYTSLNLSDAEVWAATDASLDARVTRIPIGGDDGFVFTSSLGGAIQATFPQIYRVAVTVPGGASVAVADNDLVTLDTVTRNPIVWTPIPEGTSFV